MIIANSANTATYDAASHPTTFPAMAVRPAAALPTLLRNCARSLTGTGRPASPHFAYVPGLQVREEGEHYIPDLESDKDYEADPALSHAVRAYTENIRLALALLDDAINLAGVLRLALTAGLQVREEGERPGPGSRTRGARCDDSDPGDNSDHSDNRLRGWTQEKDDEADLEPVGAARASAQPLQAALRHLDDAVNLVCLLLDAMEQDADCRAAQARTALELTLESLHEAHRLVNEQELSMDEIDGEELEEERPPMGN
ncbi:MAG: hypothetical protein WD448_10580 [Woeseia sp.]